tara:strand:- start:63 stop:212 length:150 start_codon:yes stop_codon:yes gene_type:complete
MTQYAMTTRTGSVVIKANADNLEEAIEYFSKMKQLPKQEFLKLFVVTKI